MEPRQVSDGPIPLNGCCVQRMEPNVIDLKDEQRWSKMDNAMGLMWGGLMGYALSGPSPEQVVRRAALGLIDARKKGKLVNAHCVPLASLPPVGLVRGGCLRKVEQGVAATIPRDLQTNSFQLLSAEREIVTGNDETVLVFRWADDVVPPPKTLRVLLRGFEKYEGHPTMRLMVDREHHFVYETLDVTAVDGDPALFALTLQLPVGMPPSFSCSSVGKHFRVGVHYEVCCFHMQSSATVPRHQTELLVGCGAPPIPSDAIDRLCACRARRDASYSKGVAALIKQDDIGICLSIEDTHVDMKNPPSVLLTLGALPVGTVISHVEMQLLQRVRLTFRDVHGSEKMIDGEMVVGGPERIRDPGVFPIKLDERPNSYLRFPPLKESCVQSRRLGFDVWVVHFLLVKVFVKSRVVAVPFSARIPITLYKTVGQEHQKTPSSPFLPHLRLCVDNSWKIV